VLLKLDFQKAYDTIDWSALELVMEEMRFGRKWRCWVMRCVTTASISVLFNGAPTKPFRMGRGLRQGGSLFPFLFIIMSEVLSRMLQNAANKGLFKGPSVGVDKIMLTHLQFADDTLMFCEADLHYLSLIKELLLSFQVFSGPAINYDKSALIVLGMDDKWAKSATDMLGCLKVQLPIKYLGIPLGANMRKTSSWHCIIEKVYQRLKVAKEIIKIQRKFLWSANKEGGLYHWLGGKLSNSQTIKGG